jgi:hypothetical protein
VKLLICKLFGGGQDVFVGPIVVIVELLEIFK